MLVLTRRIGEKVRIGPDVTVEVFDRTQGRAVKLGITAPRSVRIVRCELEDLEPAGHVSERDLRDAGVRNENGWTLR